MFLQSKWSCSVNTGLICTGARLGYINLNIATVPQRSDADRHEALGEGGDGDNYDGWTQKAMIQTIYKIYLSIATEWQLGWSTESTSCVSSLCTDVQIYSDMERECRQANALYQNVAHTVQAN